VQGAGCEEVLTPLKLDLQHVRGIGRGGRIAGLRVEPGGGLILWEGKRRARVSGIGMANTAGTLTPEHIPHPRWASSIPKHRAGTAQHRRLPGPQQQKGWRNQPIFPLNLISSFPPTPPQLEAGWLRRSKSGSEKRDEGSEQRVHTSPRHGRAYSALTEKTNEKA